MVKLVVTYGHPTDPEAFENYYNTTHMALAVKVPAQKVELAKIIATPDGSTPANYRIAELYFDSLEDLQAAMGSPEGQATVADLPNFASGGVDVAIAEVL